IWCGLEPLAREVLVERPAPVIVFEDLSAYQLWFAFRQETDQPKLIKVQSLSGMTEDTAYFLPRGFDEVPKISADDLNFNEMWVIYRAEGFDHATPPLGYFVGQGYEIVEQKVLDYSYQKLIGVLVRKKTS